MFRRFVIWPVAVLASFVFLTEPSLAQSLSGLTGTVTDSTGAVVTGAAIAVRNVSTGVIHRAATNERGGYVFTSLPPGPYSVECEHAGFKRFERTGVTLETGFVRNVDIRLEIGQLGETVSVTASSPLLEAENTSVGQLIERKTVASMPLESRRGAALVRLTAGVLYTGEVGGAEAVALFSLAGGRPRNQQWLLDGTTVQNSAMGVSQLAINPPIESLQEFKVEANNFSAEIGRAGGGAIVMTTRSGTNQFHGAAYEFLRNNKMDSRSFFATTRAPLRYNVFGASVGGPIARNRTFFFFNFEGARRREGITYSSDTVPRPAEVGGDFSARRDVAIRDPLTNQPFAGNRLPASRIDLIGGEIAKFYPAPNSREDDPTRAARSNYINNATDVIDSNYFFGRVDHNAGTNDRFTGRIIYFRNASATGTVYPNAFVDPRGGTVGQGRSPTYGVNWIHNLKPTVFNELRVERLNSKGFSPRAAYNSNINQKLGLRGVDPTYAPVVLVTGLTNLGTTIQQLTWLPVRLTWHVMDSVSWIRGNHSFKAGGEFRYSAQDDAGKIAPGGRFTFTDRATGDGLATLLLGWTSTATVLDQDVLRTRTDYWGGFIQDAWKVHPRVTVNWGVRWEMDTPRWERDNRQNSVDLTGINPASGTRGIVTFSGKNGVSKYLHDFDKNNFGPHFGVAWRPRDNFVVRGGYGLNFVGQYAGGLINSFAEGFGRQGTVDSPDGGFTPAFPLRNGIPTVERLEQGPGFGAVRAGQTPTFAPQFVASNHQSGYSQHWNMTLQRTFFARVLAEAAYLGNVGHKYAANRNLNVIPLVNGRGPARQDQTLRPFPQYSGLTEVNADWANSTYHAMNLKLEKRYAGGLSVLMNYTWAKFIDGGFEGQQHPDLRRLDKALSVSNVPHRLAGNVVYDLPVGRGRRFLNRGGAFNRVIGGWTAGVIMEIQSGASFGVVEQTNRSNTFGAAQRPNLIGDPRLPPDRPRSQLIEQYFNTAAFQQADIGEFGNSPRTLLQGPGQISMDGTVQKKWSAGEKYNVEIRGDFFNFPNRPNFAGPSGARGFANFGRIVSAGAGRITQLSLRLEF